MSAAITVTIVLGAAAALAAVAVKRSRLPRRRIEAMLEVARRRGVEADRRDASGSERVPGGRAARGFDTSFVGFEAHVGHATVLVSRLFGSDGGGGHALLHAGYALGAGRAFELTSRAAAAATAALDEETRRLVAALPRCRLQSDGRRVELTLLGEADADRLDLAIDVVARVAGRDADLLDALAALPGAGLSPAPAAIPGFPSVALPGGVHLGPRLIEGELVMTGWIEAAEEQPGFRFSVAAGGAVDGAAPPGLAGRVELARAAPCALLTAASRVELRWPTLVADPDRLVAGARLLELLAAPSRRYR